jgi:hypothetical protein
MHERGRVKGECEKLENDLQNGLKFISADGDHPDSRASAGPAATRELSIISNGPSTIGNGLPQPCARD